MPSLGRKRLGKDLRIAVYINFFFIPVECCNKREPGELLNLHRLIINSRRIKGTLLNHSLNFKSDFQDYILLVALMKMNSISSY